MKRKRHYAKRRRYLVYRSEARQYKNPFSRQEKRKSRRLKLYGFLIISIILILGYFLFYSDKFKIKTIAISGTRNIRSEDLRSIAEAQLKESRFLIFGQNNLFILNTKELEKKINEKYVLDQLKISRELPDGLKIEVQEKVSAIIWVSNNRYYNLDSNGIAISELVNLNQRVNQPAGSEKIKKSANSKNSQEKVVEVNQPPTQIFDIKIDNQGIGSFPSVSDESNQEVTLGQPVLAAEMISAILNLNKELPTKTNLTINGFKMPTPDSREVKVVTSEGWEIYLDTTKDLEMQLANLKLVLDQKIKNNRQKLEYIDLRFGNRVYYK